MNLRLIPYSLIIHEHQLSALIFNGSLNLNSRYKNIVTDDYQTSTIVLFVLIIHLFLQIMNISSCANSAEFLYVSITFKTVTQLHPFLPFF